MAEVSLLLTASQVLLRLLERIKRTRGGEQAYRRACGAFVRRWMPVVLALAQSVIYLFPALVNGGGPPERSGT